MNNVTSNLSIQRDQFNESVQKFKREKNIKLKQLFDLQDPQSLQLREEFWSKHEIRSYLSRGSEAINFDNDHPMLDTDRQNKRHNDYYESRIYRIAAQQNWNIFPFRDVVESNEYYLKGCVTPLDPDSDPLQIATKCDDFTAFMEVHKPDDIVLLKTNDLYVRKLLLDQQIKCGNARFVLVPIRKDNHVMAFIAVLEKGTDRILAAIHIDSQNLHGLFSQLVKAFHLRDETWSSVSGAALTEKYTRMKEELSGEKVKIDSEKRIAYLLDEPCSYFTSTPNSVLAYDALVNNQVDVIHNLYHVNDELKFRMCDSRPVTFIDASNLLQTAKDDINCSIYSFNSLQAALRMLEDKEMSETIYQNALKIGHGTDAEKKEAEEALLKTFRDDIKAYLPCYFNPDGTPKPEEELKEYHLKKRWELGSMAASNENYLRYKNFLPPDPA